MTPYINQNESMQVLIRANQIGKTLLLKQIKELNRSVPRHIKAKPIQYRKAYLWEQTLMLINEHLGETNASNEK